MNQIQIEKNVPLDSSRGNVGQNTKYPFRAMEVGDSFVYPGKIQSASSISGVAAKKIGGGVKFACRSLDKATTRIWRVS